MNSKKKNDWSKTIAYLVSLILFGLIFFIRTSSNKIELIFAFNSLSCVVFALIYMLDIKYNFKKNIYYNHSLFSLFPIKRVNLIKKEFLYFMCRLDVIIYNVLFIVLNYRIYFHSESIYIFIEYVFLLQFQISFIMLLFLLVKNSVKDVDKVMSYLVHPFFIIMLISIGLNNLMEIGTMTNWIYYLSPIHGLFYLSIINNFSYPIISYVIVLTINLALIILLNKVAQEWPI
jgi:hypothetical protein